MKNLFTALTSQSVAIQEAMTLVADTQVSQRTICSTNDVISNYIYYFLCNNKNILLRTSSTDNIKKSHSRKQKKEVVAKVREGFYEEEKTTIQLHFHYTNF